MKKKIVKVPTWYTAQNKKKLFYQTTEKIPPKTFISKTKSCVKNKMSGKKLFLYRHPPSNTVMVFFLYGSSSANNTTQYTLAKKSLIINIPSGLLIKESHLTPRLQYFNNAYLYYLYGLYEYISICNVS